MESPYALEMKDIAKQFPGVRALDGVTLRVRNGEVHGLVGENGAGKSTLMKILAGAQPMDRGAILMNGQEVQIDGPESALKLGIAIIYQEFNLVPYLCVAENIFLGREPAPWGVIRWKKEREEASRLLGELGIAMDPRRLVVDLSVAEQQMVEIAKALSLNAKLIAMDEPSATLTLHELNALFQLIGRLKAAGVSIIYISHRLDEVFQIADSITVLRDGQLIDTVPAASVTRSDLIRMMVGRELTEEFPKKRFPLGECILKVDNLKPPGNAKPVSFELKRGEILAITGLVGSGRSEVVRALFGADRPESGEIALKGRPIRIRGPADAIRQGICLLTEDRKAEGLVLGMTVRENMTLPTLRQFSRMGFVRKGMERTASQRMVDELRIKTPSIEQIVRNLSGGNQQKVVLAKWLLAESNVVIFDEPTRGIDVGAKAEIYHLMNNLVERGIGVIMISSELPEVLGMSDRILVMHEGAVTGDLLTPATNQEEIMFYATGESKASTDVPDGD